MCRFILAIFYHGYSAINRPSEAAIMHSQRCMYICTYGVYICELSTLLRKFCFYVSAFVRKKSNSDFSSKEFCHGLRRHCAGGARIPNFLAAGARGAQHKCVQAVFSVVWVGHGIFGRHRRHLCSDLRIYFTTKFTDFSTSDRMDEMNFRNQKKIGFGL